MRNVLLVFAWLALCCPVAAQTATDASIREYLQASGQEAALAEGVKQMAPALRQAVKDMPEELFRELMRTDLYATAMVPIYRRHFSEADLQEMIAFFRTPIGMKLAAKAPALQMEMLEASRQQAMRQIINYQVQRGQFTVEPRPAAPRQ